MLFLAALGVLRHPPSLPHPPSPPSCRACTPTDPLTATCDRGATAVDENTMQSITWMLVACQERVTSGSNPPLYSTQV